MWIAPHLTLVPRNLTSASCSRSLASSIGLSGSTRYDWLRRCSALLCSGVCARCDGSPGGNPMKPPRSFESKRVELNSAVIMLRGCRQVDLHVAAEIALAHRAAHAAKHPRRASCA